MAIFLNWIWGSSQTAQLLGKLRDRADPGIIQEALTHLSLKNNPTLEKALTEKLKNQDLTPIVSHLLKTTPNLLDTCYKVATLNTSQVIEQAQIQASYQLPPKTTSLASKITSQVSLKPGIVGKIVNYVLALITKMYSIDIDHPPKSRWEAQSQWSFFRQSVSDISGLKELLVGYFISTRKTALAGFGIFSAFAATKYAYHWFEHKEIHLNKRYFRDLTAEILPDSSGREEEMQTLISCICVAPGQAPSIPILIAPAGSGKTELVHQLSQKMRRGEIPQLQGKKLLAVNSTNLTGVGKWEREDDQYQTPLDLVLKELEGKEKDVILFFDEFHNAANAKGVVGGAKGAILESLKTELLERGILCILATTNDEYETHIKPNKAFIDRIRPIEMGSLDNETTKLILENKESSVEICPEAIDKIMSVADSHPNFQNRAHPRKALNMRKEAVNHVYSWRPTTLSTQINQLTAEIETIKATLRREFSEKHHKKLQRLNTTLTEKKTEQVAQNALHKLFIDLKSLQKTTREHKCTLVHRIANTTSPQETDLKSLAWIETIVLPTLNTTLTETLQEFKEKYQEEIPEKVTPELIDKLFP
jgi:ATP-dependent Clp protease ATP-binding subunit ClpA